MLALLAIHPLIWQQIAPFSDYIWFDPDLRELQEKNTFNFHKFTLIKKVVTDNFSTRKALSDKFDQQQIPPIQFDQLPGSPIVVC